MELKSPLALDKENVKKNKIPAVVELTPRQKLAFLEEQLNQIKAMHWRARVDYLHAKRLSESSNEVLKSKGLNNIAQHQNEMVQSVGAVEMLQAFIDEIKAESGETEADETHPEDL